MLCDYTATEAVRPKAAPVVVRKEVPKLKALRHSKPRRNYI